MRILTAFMAAAAVAVAPAGCVQEAGTSQYSDFGGRFSQNATQEDIQDFSARMRAWGGETAILESFPMQFRVTQLGPSVCEQARQEALSLPYVDEAAPCRPAAGPGASPDSPTANG